MTKQEYDKQWRNQNPEKIKQYYQNWKKKNPILKSRKEYQTAWRKKNVEKSRAYQKKWRDTHKEYNSRRQRPYQLKHSYGITVEQYNELLAAQKFQCAICGTKTPTGKWKVFAVDHCHITNEIRGILCNECNRGIGLLGDNVERLQKAIDYLKRSSIENKASS